MEYGYKKLLKMPFTDKILVGLEDQMVSPQICFDKSKKQFSNSKIVEILNSTKGKAISASSELYLRPWDCLELQEITAQLCGMDE